jgi:hypothetical protein
MQAPVSLIFQEAVTTASDSTLLVGGVADAFMCVTTSGDISVLTEAGNTVVFKTVALNTVIPVRIKCINATGTTATGLLALFGLKP